MSAWTRQWPEGPPDDWDDIRDRLRTMPFGRTGARQSRFDRLRRAKTPTPNPMIALDEGPQPATWKPISAVDADRLPPMVHPLKGSFGRYSSPRWWRDANPVATQRLLMAISLLLAILVIAGFLVR